MKRKINRAIIVVNLLKEGAKILLKDVQDYFKKKQVDVQVFPVQNDFKPGMIQDADIALTIGGDGTLLYCARVLAGMDVPILAVNLGDFGFITEVSSVEWKDALKKYQSGLLGISRRIMFEACVVRKGKESASFSGLNDAVIRTGGAAKIIRLQVYLSQSCIGRYRADGVILATPTGSTAYSMSAGGPILHPEMQAFILNPICPFTLSNRPIVIPDSEIVEIAVEEEQRADIILIVDGQDVFKLIPEDRIVFRKSNKCSLIILSDKRNFYEVLSAKLNWAGGPHA